MEPNPSACAEQRNKSAVLTSLFLNCLRWFAALLPALMLTAPVLAQQSSPVQYVYDALGQLANENGR
jgi:hypothetical protein